IGLTELIESDSDNTSHNKERLKIVLRNGKRLLNLINNILEFSKLETGKLEVSKSHFLTTEFLSDISKFTSPILLEKKLSLKLNFETDYDLLINTDRQKLEHIILNLLTNAIKFTNKGKITLTISETENDSIQFCVKDTGIGISKKDQELIFSEFSQLDSGNSRKYDGAGLGLAICKKFTDLLGGKINIESEKKKGSVFTIILPYTIIDRINFSKASQKYFEYPQEIPEENNTDKTAASEKEVEYINEGNGNPVISYNNNGKLRILIVDDDNDTLFTIGEILQNAGYDIAFASNGLDCLNSLEKSLPDLILLDIMMPEMDGFETISKIRNDMKFSNLIVYALTAYAMLDEKDIIVKSGFDELITKPVDKNSLLLKIRNATVKKNEK
ncbi:ATP-binding protein, partial [Bacteroidota bacterium]